ncbi:hypothetical protein AB0K80_19640 [Streptomyces sp. NPDC052682]|uniref:hypothetical protein n=1 Tax=Streptomyces sp. NPDC052682 TaxID=3154954 RepID=UPI003433F325
MLASMSISPVLVIEVQISQDGESSDEVTVTVAVAAVTAVLLSELAFDADHTAYWRRWLGPFGYLWRRALLALVPVVLAMLLCQAVSTGGGIAQQFGRGLVTGVSAAAMLRADPHLRVRGIRSTESAQSASALSWIYKQACRRFDARARQSIVAFMSQLRKPGADYRNLVTTAEEIEGVISQEIKTLQPTKHRQACQTRLDSLREQMDLVIDPYADDRTVRRAAAALAELIANEMEQRRWNRPPAIKETPKERQ